MPGRRRHSFTAIATAVVVLVANIVCLCRPAVALGPTIATQIATQSPAAHESSAHRCCNPETPVRPEPASPADRHDGEGHCPHCNGVVNAIVPVVGDGASAGVAVHVLPFHGMPASHVSVAPAASFAPSDLAIPPPLPSTLLHLHCALNL